MGQEEKADDNAIYQSRNDIKFNQLYSGYC